MKFSFALGCLIAVANTAIANAKTLNAPIPGPYTFKGTISLISGNASCLGASPASVTGDVVVNGRTLGLHIKSSSITDGIGMTFRSSSYSPVIYGETISGTVTYVRLPATGTTQGSFTAKAEPGEVARVFTETMTLNTGALIGTANDKCSISLSFTATTGLNKALLSLFNGVI